MSKYKGTRRTMGGALTVAVAVGVVAGALPGGVASAATTDRSASARSATTGDHAQLQAIMDRLTTVDGAPGALLETGDRHGGSTVLTSGVADVKSQAPVARDSRFRIGSMTKPFVATVVLQLVRERRVVLDAPVARYLPDLMRDGEGNKDGKITVRQLLQHTSGLPDYLDLLSPAEILKDPFAHHDPRDLVNLALAAPRTFEPGKGWDYSNTDYLLVGMLIEKVTGHPYGDEIRRRIIEPLSLSQTSVPGDDPVIEGTHPRGYVRPGKDAPLLDLTEFNPSVAGASGEMISSAGDLNHFLDALVGGELLYPAELRQMMTTERTGDKGRRYGLGLESNKLPCGGRYWGHGGDVFGFQTAGGVTADGSRQATVMATVDPGGTDAQDDDMKAAIETALCQDRH
ncbi:serine hydrolase domain-containing protein [Streptomyces longispororuber]|uniref:serine hydrolase domain-containing protein n=1 Tax=Streptomyces longispororuber TaxID=68230 RepID=UPI00210B856D|nr:serine hydrolase domain-containing protein [Streptomyces longispororuber]MCQ4210882.1 beta-lactamase family protein [Streptomyces longispororuber]